MLLKITSEGREKRGAYGKPGNAEFRTELEWSSNRGKLGNSLAAVRREIFLSEDLEMPLNVRCLRMKLNHWNYFIPRHLTSKGSLRYGKEVFTFLNMFFKMASHKHLRYCQDIVKLGNFVKIFLLFLAVIVPDCRLRD